MRLGVCVLFCAAMHWTEAQPATDIYLYKLTPDREGWVLSDGINITHRKGYDNQPFFHPEKSVIYYTAADDSGDTDIYGYDYNDHTTASVTHTREKEYSPTVTPDGKFLSCIIQRENGAQDLGKYPINGGKAIVLIDNLTIGYHAWIDNETVAVFVLGDPITLHRMNLKNGKDEILATSIGRSLQAIPGSHSVSVVQKDEGSVWAIGRITAEQSTVEILGTTLPAKEDHAWSPDHQLFMSDGTQLYYRTEDGVGGWQRVKMIGELPAGEITRISISKAGDIMALVVDE